MTAPPRARHVRFHHAERAASEVLGTVLLVAMAVVLLGAFAGVVFSALFDADDGTASASFRLSATPGGTSVNITHLDGSAIDANDARLVLVINGGVITTTPVFTSQATSGRLAPGDVMRFDLLTPLSADDTVYFLAASRTTGRSIGSASGTVLSSATLPAYVTSVSGFGSLTLSGEPLVVDGRDEVTLSVSVSSTFGLAFIDRIVVNLTPLGGSGASVLRDDGISPDSVAGDGIFVTNLRAFSHTFSAQPGLENVTLALTLYDALGKTTTTTVGVLVKSPQAEKVVAGATWHDVSPSSDVAYLNLTNFSFRDIAALGNDQVELRVSDVANAGTAWRALLSFDACGGGAGSTSIVLTRDGVSGSAAYTPADGCFNIDVDSQVSVLSPSSSLNENATSETWTVTGSAATFAYTAAGIGSDNIAAVTYVGDTVTGGAAAIGWGQADLTWRATSSVSATAPGAPQSAAASASDRQVALTWSAPSSDGGNAVSAYRIYRGTTSGVLTLLDTVGTNTSYVAAGLTNGVTYYFDISAVNAVGESAHSGEVSATPIGTPGAPQSFAATPGAALVNLSWSSPVSNGGSPISAYKIYRGTTSGALTLLDTIATNTTYTAAGLSNGVTYYFQVSAVNGAGEGDRASEASATPVTTPTAPQSLGVVGGVTSLVASWNAPASNGGSAITNYKVYLGTTSGALSLLDTIGTNTSYTAAGLVANTTYYVQVSAVNAQGEGARAAEVSATVDDVPSAPRSLVATPASGQISLSWSAPSNDHGNAVTAYKIYRGTTSGALTLLDTIGANTSYTAAGLSNGVAYYLHIVAVNGVGDSAPSNEATATPVGVPSAPQALVLTPAASTVGLSWSPPASNGGSAITAYRIYRGTSSGALSLLATLGTNTSYSDVTVTNGVTYYYQVSAVNANGESAKTAESSATPATTPGAPQSRVLTSGASTVGLSWSAPASNGGAAVTSYRVYRGTTSGALSLLATIGTNTSFSDVTASNGVTYYYQVSAVNSKGEGPRTAESSATPGTPPGVPQSLVLTPGASTVGLSWSAPASNGGAALTSYKIYRGTTSGALSLLATIGTNTSFSDVTLSNGVTYYYQVSAVNSKGEGPRTAESSATPATTPGAPQSLGLTPGNRTVTMSWSAPASNGGAAITNYKIYRGTTSGALTLKATIGTNTSFADSTVTNGVTYYYQVSAVNAKGEGPRTAESDTRPVAVPFPPGALIATAGQQLVNLSWTAPTDTGGSALTGYRIYRGTVSGSLSLIATIGTNTSYSAAGLSSGTTYYFHVRAINTVGVSGASNEASATPIASSVAYFGCPPTSIVEGLLTNCANLQAAGDGLSATLDEGGGNPKKIDIRLTGTGGPISGTHTLQMRGQVVTKAEDLYVQVSTNAGTSWTTIITLPSTATTMTTLSGTLTTAQFNNGAPFIRFADINTISGGSDAQSSSWDIDYIRVTTT